MFDIKATAGDLDSMLRDFIIKGGIITPVSKNVYRYKNYLVTRDKSGGWNVFLINGNTKRHIESTFLKVSAFAICKAHDKHKYNVVLDIKQEDSTFERNYLDSLFFKNTYKKSQDYNKKDTALWRFEIVHEKAAQAKKKIDSIFYSSIV